MNLAVQLISGGDWRHLATRARWEDIQKHWKLSSEGLDIPIWPLVAAGLLIGAIVLGVWAWRQVRGATSHSAGLVTFHRIAKELGMGLADQWLLIRIGQQQHLATPLTLILSRGTLQHHAQRYIAETGASRRSRLEARVRGVEVFLFGQPS